MGWVVMSERELQRVEVLAQVDDGRLSIDNAANMLALTRRQIFRLLKLYLGSAFLPGFLGAKFYFKRWLQQSKEQRRTL